MSGAILALYHLENRLGLAPLYVFVGSNQYLQAILAATLYVPLAGDLAVSPGSVVLFTSSLFAILLIYIREDVPRTRTLIYGVVISNLTLTSLSLISRWQVGAGALNRLGVPAALFEVNARLFLVGTLTLVLDSLLIVVAYEYLFLMLGRPSQPVRIVGALLVVLYFDAVVFTTGSFYGSPDYGRLLAANLLGKTLSGCAYGLVLFAYLKWVPGRASRSAPRGVEDVFALLTYRERYELAALRLETLRAIDRGMLEARSAEELAGGALAGLRRLLRSQVSCVALFDEAGREARVLAVEASGASRLAAGARLPLPAEPAGWLEGLRRGEPVATDLACPGGLAPPPGLVVEAARWQAAVPLLVRGALTGAVVVARAPQGHFGADELRVLREVADGLAIALDGARLPDSERARREEAEAVRAANLALSSSLELDQVLATLLECLERLVPYDSASIMLREAGSRLRVTARRGYEKWTDAGQTQRLVFDGGRNPALAPVLAGNSWLIPDTREFPGWERPKGAEHVVCWFGVPLLAEGRVIGLYSVDNREPGSFTQEHLRRAQALAPQAAAAIQNARLHLELRGLAAQLEGDRDRLRALSQRLIETQEGERRRLAEDLHDQLGQALTVLKLRLQLLERGDPAAAGERLQACLESADEAIEEVRSLASQLLPSTLEDLGLAGALRALVERPAQEAGLRLRLELPEAVEAPAEVALACYRLAQEALTNVMRHARARTLTLCVEAGPDGLLLAIEDDGVGFDPASLARGGLGLVGMRERARLAGGELELASAPGVGTQLRARFPSSAGGASARASE